MVIYLTGGASVVGGPLPREQLMITLKTFAAILPCEQY